MTTTQHFTRRRFLKAVGVTAAAMTCAGLGYAATRTPAVATSELTLQKDTAMNKRILVTYATRAGSTAEIAQAIAETLAGRGCAADIKPVKEKPSLDGYSAVVLGSAIRMGTWLPEAVNFVKANQAALNALPIALFTAHTLNTGDDETSRTARAAYLDAIQPLLNGAKAVYFEGKMDFSRLSFLDRTVAKMVKSVEADHRDWIGIRQWANAIWS